MLDAWSKHALSLQERGTLSLQERGTSTGWFGEWKKA